MIEVTINESTDYDPIKKVYFSDSTGNCFRTSYFDKDGKFIFERNEEIQLSKEGVQSTCLFVGENYELVAYREYLRSENSKGTKDFHRLKGGTIKQINSSEYVTSDDPYYSKMSWFSSQGELCYYNESNRSGTDFYDPSGNVIENLDEYLLSIGFESLETIAGKLLNN